MYVLQPDTINGSAGTSPIAVASAGVVYTKSHKINFASVFGLSVLANSVSGTPAIQIDMQVSDTAPDAKEAIADSDSTDWCTQEGGSTLISVTDEVLHKLTINPTPAMYVRFKLTGLGSPVNPADSTIILKLITQQQLGR